MTQGTTDWIKTRADEIRRIEKERKAEKERQLEAAVALKARLEPFWNELVTCLDQSAGAFNVEFPEPERRINEVTRPSPAVIVIKRSAHPSATVKAQLNTTGTAVNYTVSRTLRKGTEPVEKLGSCSFGVVDDAIVYTDGGVSQHEDVAKILFEPFFEF